MKSRFKVFASVMTLAVMLTGCGSAIETTGSIPEIDDGLASVTNVSVNEAADNVSENESVSDGTNGNEINSADSSDIVEGVMTASEEKEEFDYVPEYDEEFFSNDLFIGDSISTGYSGYGILNAENVYAKIGLNPLSALDTEVDTPDGELLLTDEISLKKPDRAYIMLGSNGIEWLACSNMLDALNEIINAIHDASPETQVVCLTIPPVTKEYDDNNEEVDVMDKINDYNERLKEMCDDKEIECIDITEMLKDSEGYFVSYYAETDGMHFKPTAYKMILAKIEYTLS